MTSLHSRLCRLFAVTVAAVVSFATYGATNSYSLSGDFSVASNPNGVWTYGYTPTLGGAFTKMAVPRTDEVPSIPIWSWSVTGHESPDVHFNASRSNVFHGDGGTFPPGTLWVSPGHETSSNSYAVMRFSAPTSGVYHLDASARTYLDAASGDAEYHILKNGTRLISVALAAGSQNVRYTNDLELVTADKIDLVVGRGPDGILAGTALKLEAILTTMANPGPTNTPPANPALVSLWHANGNTLDSVGTNHGVSAGMGYGLGLSGQAFRLTGSNFVRVPHSPSLTLTSALSVALWYKADGAPPAGADYTILDKRDFDTSNYGLSLSRNFGLVVAYNDPRFWDFEKSISPQPSSDVWHYLVGTFSQLSNGVRVVTYVDGSPVQTSVLPGSLAASANTVPVSIGSARNGASDFFKGLIDEVALYNYALTVSEVASNYTSFDPGTNSPPQPGVFNVEADFTLSHGNPNGVWSYGWKSELGGAFGLVTNSRIGYADNGVPYEIWEFGHGRQPLFIHFPENGTETGTSDGGAGQYPPGTLLLDPGPNGAPENYAVIRFTAPSNGNYSIAAQVNPVYTGYPQGDSDFHLVKNGIELFGRFLMPMERTGYTNVLAMNGGDSVDFIVGRGADNDEYGSSRKLSAIIVPSLLVVTNPPATNAPRSLVSLWRADGNTRDSVGTNDGTSVGVEYALGLSGQAFRLTGTNFVRVPHSPSLTLTDALSVSLWYKADGAPPVGADYTILDKRDYDTSNYGLSLSRNFGLVVAYNDPHYFDFEKSTSPLPASNVWHQLIGTFAQVSNGVRVVTYVDGVGVQTNLLSGSLAAAANTVPVSIGSAQNGSGHYFKGLIDEVGLYNYALSPSEVSSNYNRFNPGTNSPPVTPGLVSLWHADGNSQDAAGTNNGVSVNNIGYAPGISGQAFRLTGTNFVRVPHSPSLTLTNAVSVALWFKSDGGPSAGVDYTLLDKRDFNTCNYGAHLSVNFGLSLFYNDPRYFDFENSASPLPSSNAWHHFVGTFSQLSNGVRVVTYVDGLGVQTNLLPGTLAAAANTVPVSIGSAQNGSADYFKGLIDEVALYNYALSPSEVTSNYNRFNPETNVPPVVPMLVSLWRADGNTQDSVGTNHGVNVNNIGFAAGVSGQAFRFSGTNFVRVTDSPSLDLSNELTIALWYKRDTNLPFGTAFTLVDKREQYCNYGANMSQNYGTLLYYDAPAQGGFETISGPLLSADIWHHFAGTFKQLSNGVRMVEYLDGAAVVTNTLPGTLASAVNNGPLAIGAAGNGVSDFFKGLIDEVALYNYALSSLEVSSNYNRFNPGTNSPPVTPGLVSLWHADGNTQDAAGTNNGVSVNNVGYAPGISGQAFRLTGTNFVRVPHSPSLTLTSAASVSLWYMADGRPPAGADYTLFDKREFNTCNYGASLSQTFGLVVFYNDPHYFDFEKSLSPQPGSNVWHHFVGTFAQLSNGVQVVTYIDGSAVKTNVLQGSLAAAANTVPVSIGSAQNGSSDYFKGWIDEVAIYNYPLSSSEVSSNYSRFNLSTNITASAKRGVIGGLLRSADGTLQFQVAGEVGTAYVVEASSNLIDWTSIATLVNSNGVIEFNDPAAASMQKRFYRTRPIDP